MCKVHHHSPIFARLVVFQLVLDHSHHDLVTNQTTCIHNLLRLSPELSLLRDLLAQHVSGRQVADTPLVTNSRSLGSLSCTQQSITVQQESAPNRAYQHQEAQLELCGAAEQECQWQHPLPLPPGHEFCR